MNAGNELLDLGFQALANFHSEKTATGDPALVLVRTGKTFQGVIEILPPIDPDMPIGRDPRSAAILHLLRADDPGIEQTDKITLSTDSSQVWEVGERENNQADSITKFWLNEKVSGTDA